MLLFFCAFIRVQIGNCMGYLVNKGFFINLTAYIREALYNAIFQKRSGEVETVFGVQKHKQRQDMRLL